MTRINKLYLKGFKSFAKPSTLDFINGFNCILGPNGAGKSNVLDALCFVLGRSSAKSLRVEKSANLIYNGGPTKKALDRAEVSIFFDNKNKTFPVDTDEVKLSRIVKKTGNSVYKINDKTKTRSEVQELLNNARIDSDGFNIVLQGDITRFCLMPTVERRQIIEEVANISQYENKKQKAMHELDKVDEKLKEAHIILDERKNRLKELQKERNQALKYKQVEEEIKLSKLAFLSTKLADQDGKHSKIYTDIEKYKEKIKLLDEKVKENNLQIEEIRKTIEAINAEINEKGETEQVSIHKEIEVLKVDVATRKTKLTNVESNIEKLNERITQLINDKNTLNTELSVYQKETDANKKLLTDLNTDLSYVEEKLKKIREKSDEKNIEEIETEMNRIEKSIEEIQKSQNETTQTQQNLLREKDKLEYQLENIDKQIEKMSEVEKEHKSQLDKLRNTKEEFKTVTLQLNEKLNKDSDYGAQISNAKSKLNIITNSLSKLEQKQFQILSSTSNNQALNEVSSLARSQPGIYGTLTALAKVDSKYATALETAAGNKLNFVIVDNDSTAIKCINQLKQKRLGSASFIPLNKVKTSPVKVDPKILSLPGVHGLALDLVRYDKKFENAFNYVFGSAIVVDDLETAKRIGIGDYKFVTIGGDISEKSGVLKGGFKEKRRSLFELSEVNSEIEQLNEELSNSNAVIDKLQRSRIENENDIVAFRHKKSELEAEVMKLEKALHISDSDLDSTNVIKNELNEKLKEVDHNLMSVRQDMQIKMREIAKLKSEKEIQRNKIQSLRNPKIMAELNAFDDKKSKIKEQIIRLESQVTNTLSNGEIKSKELEKIDTILKQHDKELKTFKETSLDQKTEISRLEKELITKENAAKEFYEKYKELFNKRTKLDSQILAIEKLNESKRDETKGFEIKSNIMALELTKVDTEINVLREQIKEFEHLKESHGDALQEKMKKDVEDLKKEVVNYERILNNIGLVNMKAIEIYEGVENEYNRLVEKHTLLQDEKTKVLTLINEVETKKKDLFLETYNHVNERFREIFQLLAPKGKAFLDLEDPDKIFETGVAIKVNLGEKKTLDIRSLSGGEKTLTALSFIFAIQEHKPHSFYILDEVDAALDKFNSEKLAKLVRKYTDFAQYVVISHNESLMSEADALFGVSMDKDNISKITSMRI